MINSLPLKKNPNLYAFLPIFYMVWSDAVLTPSELATIHSLIDRQDWLNAEEKGFLLEHVNPANPPSPDELKDWYTEIQKVTGTKMKGQAAGKMGYTTSQIGDLVAEAL